MFPLSSLREEGWELVEFSPLRDLHLPEHLDGIYLGGGYPEVYARELSANHSLLSELRQAASDGVKILAECGGFLYLHKTLEGEDKAVYPMAGVIDAEGYRTERLSRFGYLTLEEKPDSSRPLTGQIRGHEFHYWDSTNPGSDRLAVKPGNSRSWDCMYVTDTIAAGFPHLYYLSAPEWIRQFLGESGCSG